MLMRDVSSVASGSHGFHIWLAGPLTGIALMVWTAGMDDECVDALLILLAAKMEVCVFPDGGVSLASHNWQPILTRKFDARVITSLPTKFFFKKEIHGFLRTPFLPNTSHCLGPFSQTRVKASRR